MAPYKSLATLSEVLLVTLAAILVFAPGAWAQSSFKTLYTFTGGADGREPYSGLTFDAAGNLYGTTWSGGAHGFGEVFELSPNLNGSWSESVIHSFCPSGHGATCSDGRSPSGSLVFDAAGNLYGTAGTSSGGGVIFELAPNLDGRWTESTVYSPRQSVGNALVFDGLGNLYGTAGGGNGHYCGEDFGCGQVFELSPNPDGSWTESTIYSFCSINNCLDGDIPQPNLVFDTAGNLYGTTRYGGNYNELCHASFKGCGVAFKLTPTTGGSWSEKVIYHFPVSKASLYGLSLPSISVFDHAGNLYGTTLWGGKPGCVTGCGTIFELTPNTNGSWKEKTLYSFYGKGSASGRDGGTPNTSLVFDKRGSLYGTTQGGGDLQACPTTGPGCGVVFKLTPNANGGWGETVLNRFGDHPGALPQAGVIFDAAENIYGTTSGDGFTTFGSVYEITP
jgi:uncharacterized repeat protein (TIGR03803 family)